MARRKWGQFGTGTIVDLGTGRRMAIFGSTGVDSIFEDLKSELGDAIEDTIVEAQRRYIKAAWRGDGWNRDGASFQHVVALRGAGNIIEFEGDRTHLDLTVQNSCFHLPLVGTVQGLVEMVYGVESSSCEWEITDDGDLNISVKVR